MNDTGRVRLCIATAKEFCGYAYKLNFEIGATHVIRLVRGKKMRLLVDLYTEFGAAFQLPCYFGENWNAFDECLADLEWLPASGYMLLVLDAADVLNEEENNEFATFVRLLRSISLEWFNSRQISFQVIFQCDTKDVDALQRRAAVPLEITRFTDLPLNITK